MRDEQVLYDRPMKAAAIQATKIERRPYDVAKRFFDIVLSLCGLVILSPLFLITAVAIRLDSKGPAFYSQKRIGKNGKPFKMYKFRSMCVDAEQQLERLAALNERDGPTFKITHDPRVTRVGRFLRRYSIDELPQLFCVLAGTMSFIGPRPFIPEETKMLKKEHLIRLTVKPGLTGLAQISGRNNLNLEERMEKDLEYIEKMSAWLDIKILWKTIFKIADHEGAS